MSSPKISIIVPVYKVEKYLRRCLDSIVAQTFTDWECILVDDGSPDNSGEICDEYAQKDYRFKVIHQENKGVSAARNKGLDEAKGEWIGFVDSDDWIENNFVEILLANSESNCLVIGDIRIIGGKQNNRLRNENISGDFFPTRLFKSGEKDYLGYISPKLYYSKIIKDFSIRFNEDIYYNEDRLFVLQYVLHCQKVVICNDIIYNYFQRNDSAMGKTKVAFSVKMISELKAFEIMQMLLRGKNEIAFSYCSYEALCATNLLLRRCDKQNKSTLKIYKRKFFESAFKSVGFVDKIKCLIRYFL